MRTVSRRDLSHNSSRILDRILDTGEPVEVPTKGRETLIITKKPMSVYEEWKAQGLVRPARGRLADTPMATTASSLREILDDISSDH